MTYKFKTLLPLIFIFNVHAATSFAPVDIKESFDSIYTKMVSQKSKINSRQKELLKERYDLSNEPIAGVKMTRGKPIQAGTRVKLPKAMSWDKLGQMTPEEIKDKNVFPEGFMPLPHPNHPEGGMLFPVFHIDEIKKQTGRDLTRFDLDFDFPDHFLPEFPPAIFLTTRTDLGDVSKGKLVTQKK